MEGVVFTYAGLPWEEGQRKRWRGHSSGRAVEEETAIQKQPRGFWFVVNPGSEGARSCFVVPADR